MKPWLTLFALTILSCSDGVAAPVAPPSSTSTCRMGEASCTRACDAGDLRSCYFFGRMLSDGNGVRKDEQRAFDLFHATCEKGLGDACNAEAVTIRDGLLDGRREYVKSLPGFEKGCANNSSKGCNNAAKIHQDLKTTRSAPLSSSRRAACWRATPPSLAVSKVVVSTPKAAPA